MKRFAVVDERPIANVAAYPAAVYCQVLRQAIDDLSSDDPKVFRRALKWFEYKPRSVEMVCRLSMVRITTAYALAARELARRPVPLDSTMIDRRLVQAAYMERLIR